MQSVYEKYNQFQRQSQSDRDMVRVEQLNRQVKRLGQLKNEYDFETTSQERKDIEHFIKVYKLALKQIQRMKMQFTKPSLVKERLAQIFSKQKQQFTLDGIMERNSDIRSSQIQIPTFKNTKFKENVIDAPNNQDELASPGLRNFFSKKQAQLMNRGTSANFKSVLQQPPSNKSFSKSNNRSVSRQQQSSVSRSSASSFLKKNSKQSQLKKILEENKKIKQEYQKRLKREMELNEFEKNLLKEEKNRYMQKIEQMQSELENLYRANYKLKQEVEIKEKEIKQKTSFNQSSSSFRNIDEDIQPHIGQNHDYYQPYVMKTKHNDLKRLSMKCHSDFDMESNHGKNDPFLTNLPVTQGNSVGNNLAINPTKKTIEEASIDILGNELQKQLKQLQKQRSRSNNSHVSSKKWSRQYNPDKYQNNLQKQQQKQEFLRVLRQDDEQQNKGSQNPFQKKQTNTNFRQFQGHSINIIQPAQDFNPPPSQNGPNALDNNYYSRKSQQQSVQYRPAPNYSFTKNSNKDYSIQSNLSNYDTFDMTGTYLNISQNEQQSLTNKYIDSRTSTRNKVAFFKDSLILIKNQTFQLAFKRSALVETKDRVRIIFFIKNKTNRSLTVNFKYQYDAGYFKIKVNEKLETVPPNGQARQDLEVYSFSTIDLNQVIDILLQVNYEKFGLWMPILWIQLSDNQNFNMPTKNQEISIIPDRQFKNYDTARTIMPLIFGGMNSTSQWAYLYGKSKFGPCYIKLIWQMSELRIQSNSKWIDLLAFVMHHVK